LRSYEDEKRAVAVGEIIQKLIRISIRRYVFFIRMVDYEGVLKSFFSFEVKAFIKEKDIYDEDGNYVGKEVIWRVCQKDRESRTEAC
jgi:hypothetical protein